nr:SpaH/EbpB family LPXTG-anchored major pilin [Arcanobacterium phocae]
MALSILGSLTLVGGTASAATDLGNIQADKEGSVTVHKYEAPEWDQNQKPANGTELTAPDGAKTINGVTFTLQKIQGIELTKQADWSRLKALTPENAPLEGKVFTQTTANQGVATFGNLPVGAYVLKEQTPPANLNIAKKAADSIVTIPFPTDATTVNSARAEKGWIYDVHVYPKNEVANKLTKKVADNTPTTIAGSEIKWELTVPIPNATKPFTKFEVSDQLYNTIKLNENKTTVTLNGQDITNKVTISGTGAEGAKVIFNFAGALDSITAARGQNVVITFNAEIVSVPKDGIIPNNEFSLTYQNEGDNEDKVVPPPTDDNEKPKAYFGDFKIKKVSSLGNKLPLQGAEFKLYKTQEDANAQKNEITTVKSDENGIVSFTGVFRGATVAGEKDYWIRETAAPAGYKLSTDNAEVVKMIKISGTSGKAEKDMDIENVPFQPNDVPNLPLTGAAGKVLLIFAGVAILAISFGTAFVTRRNKANN